MVCLACQLEVFLLIFKNDSAMPIVDEKMKIYNDISEKEKLFGVLLFEIQTSIREPTCK